MASRDQTKNSPPEFTEEARNRGATLIAYSFMEELYAEGLLTGRELETIRDKYLKRK